MVNDSFLSIIPEPASLIQNEGSFDLKSDTTIYFEPDLQMLAQYLSNLLKHATGFNLYTMKLAEDNSNSNSILLRLIADQFSFGEEGYKLEVSPDKIELLSLTSKGAFYGIQTLRQLFPPEIESSQIVTTKWNVPCVEIEDYPRFSWRGFMLDEARHFFGREVVKKILDIMALLKLNIFHWHLTDDQGWRVEIKKYPLLIEVGSKRSSSKLSIFKRDSDNTPYNGFYTQEELKEIIQYAQERYIQIIPEIDVPGHTKAMLASYPELGCTGGPYDVSIRPIEISNNVLCIGKDNVFKLVKNVLKEIINIFPSNIIHIGGDEVPTKSWQKCEFCQLRMKNASLRTERDLQGYFTNNIVNFLNDQGKLAIGWNEILNNSLNEDTICQYWNGNFNLVIEHIKNHRKVIMSEEKSVYISYGYKRIPFLKTYNYEPIPENLEKKYHKNILGIEACFWSEFALNKYDLEYYTFPRLIAIAETGWTLRHLKNFNAFQNRLPYFLKRMDYLNINYSQNY